MFKINQFIQEQKISRTDLMLFTPVEYALGIFNKPINDKKADMILARTEELYLKSEEMPNLDMLAIVATLENYYYQELPNRWEALEIADRMDSVEHNPVKLKRAFVKLRNGLLKHDQ